jgi:hypothetical protein
VDTLNKWETKALRLEYVDGKGNRKAFEAGPVGITVTSNLGEKPQEARLKPIRDILPVRGRWREYLPWGVGALAFLAAVAGVIWFYKNRRDAAVKEKPLEPPHDRAKKEIYALMGRGLFEKGEIKTFYFALSGILKRYLEDIRHFPAAESTTEEIALQVHHAPDREMVVLLRHADLVKFADHVPTPARKDADLRNALLYIDQTGTAGDEDMDGKTGEMAP